MKFAIAAIIATYAIAQKGDGSAQDLDWNEFSENGVLGNTGPGADPNAQDLDWNEFGDNGQLGDSSSADSAALDLDWDKFDSNQRGNNGGDAQDLDWNEFGENGQLGGIDNFMGDRDSASFLISGAAIALTTVLAL